MESQLPYNRMTEGQVEATQPAQPTVIVASTSSPVTRYKNHSSRLNVTLGIIQIVCAVLLMGFSITLIALVSPVGYVSDGIWCGVIIILSGSFNIAAGRIKTKCWIVTSLVFSILAAVFVIPVLMVSGSDIAATRDRQRYYEYDLRDWERHRDSSYYYYPHERPFDAFYALNGLRIFVAVVQGIVAILASVMACRPLCCSGHQTATPQVQYVGHPPGQQVIMMTPQQIQQPVMGVPVMMQQGYTAPVLTPAGAPPMYTTIPAAPVVTQLVTPPTQPIPTPTVQQTGDTQKGTIG